MTILSDLLGEFPNINLDEMTIAQMEGFHRRIVDKYERIHGYSQETISMIQQRERDRIRENK
jgi:hypothetical protein